MSRWDLIFIQTLLTTNFIVRCLVSNTINSKLEFVNFQSFPFYVTLFLVSFSLEIISFLSFLILKKNPFTPICFFMHYPFLFLHLFYSVYIIVVHYSLLLLFVSRDKFHAFPVELFIGKHFNLLNRNGI